MRAPPGLLTFLLGAASAAGLLLARERPPDTRRDVGPLDPSLALPDGQDPSRPTLPANAYFVLYAPTFSDTCGGCVVVHVLCDALNRRFGSVHAPAAYLRPWDDSIWPGMAWATNPAYATPILPPWLPAEDGIAIYTDTVRGNPLNASKVVRWMLYFRGSHEADTKPPDRVPDDQIVACLKPSYCREFRARPTLPLFVFDFQLDFYLNLPTGQRNGTLYFAHKNRYEAGGKRLRREAPDLSGKDVPVGTGKRARLERFASASAFVSYDPSTHRSVEAAVAGCASVVVALPGLDREGYFGAFSYPNGIGYGLDEAGWSVQSRGKLFRRVGGQIADMSAHLDGLVGEVARRWYPGAAGGGDAGSTTGMEDLRTRMMLERIQRERPMAGGDGGGKV